MWWTSLTGGSTGSLRRLVAVLVPDEKRNYFYFWPKLKKKMLSFLRDHKSHLENDGSPMNQWLKINYLAMQSAGKQRTMRCLGPQRLSLELNSFDWFQFSAGGSAEKGAFESRFVQRSPSDPHRRWQQVRVGTFVFSLSQPFMLNCKRLQSVLRMLVSY